MILALDLQHQWSSDNGITKPSTLFIPWSGEVSQQHTDCIEIPREYALVNGFSPDSTQAAPDGSELSGTSPSDGVNQFPVVVSVLSPLEFYPLEGAVLVPASLLDWQVIYTHKTLIEDSLLQKVRFLHKYFDTIKIISIYLHFRVTYSFQYSTLDNIFDFQCFQRLLLTSKYRAFVVKVRYQVAYQKKWNLRLRLR